MAIFFPQPTARNKDFFVIPTPTRRHAKCCPPPPRALCRARPPCAYCGVEPPNVLRVVVKHEKKIWRRRAPKAIWQNKFWHGKNTTQHCCYHV
jgi:hypothetical protein